MSHSQVNASSLSGMYYGIGSGPIFPDKVQCNGTESRLASCRYKRTGVHNCNNLESASVTCKGNDTAVFFYFFLCMHFGLPLSGGVCGLLIVYDL